jgi:hypothetical protein
MMRSVVVSMCTSAFCISRALRTIHSNSNQRSGPHRVPSYSGTFIDGSPAHAIIPMRLRTTPVFEDHQIWTAMSALGQSDIRTAKGHVRFTPESGHVRRK